MYDLEASQISTLLPFLYCFYVVKTKDQCVDDKGLMKWFPSVQR